jgi:hypothetical protein
MDRPGKAMFTTTDPLPPYPENAMSQGLAAQVTSLSVGESAPYRSVTCDFHKRNPDQHPRSRRIAHNVAGFGCPLTGSGEAIILIGNGVTKIQKPRK